MKLKRQKQAKKTISFYKYNFSFREPFQVLIDGTFCQAALKNKIQIKEQIPKYLMGEVQLCTTNCALKELETLGKELYGAKVILQRFQIRSCSHFKSPVPASECLLSMLGETNPHHYFVATQDFGVTEEVKRLPGVPLIYIVVNTMVLEKPSVASQGRVAAVQAGELVTPAQQQSISSLKEQQGIGPAEGRGRKRKRKRSNPNPLSCLKKKKRKAPPTPAIQGEGDGKKGRSRSKKRKTGDGPSEPGGPAGSQ
ncbi:rRNA-processing protein UTP23 homolog [Gadus morhua]|uniref:rRNA-processing protein UTP23 homolog n=1 Tax=Gadus morhua TaxID=8049 RepID=A0A8C5CSA2_GADMO|nr:rRNA-processing protein UTP23 homolog [Gadus morhua]